MSKNLTRKGIAFGALVALGTSVIAGVPANAVGDDGNVRLAVSTGAEYDVRAADYFDLAANWSDAVAGTGKYMKYQVSATTGSVKYDVDTNGANTDEIYTVTNGLGLALVATGTTSATVAPGSSTTATKVTFPGHGLVAGDSVKISGAAGANAATLNGYRVVASVSGDDIIFTTADTTGMTITGAAIALDKIASNTGTVIKLYTAAAHKFQINDSVTIAGAESTVDGSEAITAIGTNYIQITETLAATTVIGDGSETITSNTGGDGLDTAANIRAKAVGSYNIVAGADASVAYNLTDTTIGTNKFIIDTNDADNTGAYDHTVRLVANDTAVTTTATIQAWVDRNDNGLIDTDESTSPVRTVRFLKAGDISATTTILPATVGESTVTAEVVFTPTLNGNLIIANEGLTASTITNAIAKVDFTRQGDATKVTGATNGSYSNTTKKWTFVSQDFATGNGWTDTAATKVSLGGSGSVTVVVWKGSITSNVATVTTGSYAASAWTAADHGLRVGDTVRIQKNGSTGSARFATAAAVKVASVPTSSSFTYAVDSGNESVDAVASQVFGNTATSDNTYLSTATYLRDKVEAGTVTAQFYLDADGTGNVSASSPTIAQTVAAKASYEVGGKVVGASGVSVAGVGSTTVNTSGKILTGTTSASFEVKVKDADAAYVGAGVDVAITASKSSVGTVTINGNTVGTTSSTFYAKTNASGKVVLEIANSSALAGDTVSISAASQTATGSITATWEDRKFSVLDVNDQTLANSNRNRQVESGSAYTFNLLVQDQFKAPADSALYRLVAYTTGRTIATTNVALTAGKATFAVADGGQGTGSSTSVALTFQKLVNAVWVDQFAATNTTYSDWNNGTGYNTTQSTDSGDVAPAVINYVTSANVLTLNANAANYPGNGTADNSAAVAVNALKAIDLRSTIGSAGVYTASETATVSGQLTSSAGVVRPGAAVTVSAAGLLFKSGDVYSLDKITVLANASGQFSVDVLSASAGVKTVTVAVGAVSATSTITFTGVSTDVKKLTVTPNAATYVAGQTVTYTIKLTDLSGNPVDTTAAAATPAAAFITVTYAGPGIISGSLPVETDAAGEATVRIVTGVSDAQSAVLTVKYDQNYDGDVLDTTDLTVVSTVAVKAAPEIAATITGATKKISFTIDNSKGELVQIKVGNKTVKTFTAYSNAHAFGIKAVKGSQAVKVYVAGDLVAAKTVSVK